MREESEGGRGVEGVKGGREGCEEDGEEEDSRSVHVVVFDTGFVARFCSSLFCLEYCRRKIGLGFVNGEVESA